MGCVMVDMIKHLPQKVIFTDTITCICGYKFNSSALKRKVTFGKFVVTNLRLYRNSIPKQLVTVPVENKFNRVLLSVSYVKIIKAKPKFASADIALVLLHLSFNTLSLLIYCSYRWHWNRYLMILQLLTSYCTLCFKTSKQIIWLMSRKFWSVTLKI